MRSVGLLLIFVIVTTSEASPDSVHNIREVILSKVHSGVVMSQEVCSQGLHNLAEDGNCDYYVCLEEAVNCTDKGYPAGYGNRYCNKINDKKDNLNPEGQRWADGFKVCTMTRLNSYLQNMIKSCESMKEVAFNYHMDCLFYDSEAALCEAIKEPANWDAILSIFTTEDNHVGEDHDFVIYQLMQASRSCLYRNYKRDTLGDWNVVRSTVDTFLNRLEALLSPEPTDAEGSPDSQCQSWAQEGDCRFYECFNERFKCGSDAKAGHVLHFEMITCQMLELHSRMTPSQHAKQWAKNHQKCMMSHLLSLYGTSNMKCSALQPFMFNKRTECLHTTTVQTCRLNADTLALTLDRVLDLESYPSATLKRMMYLSKADSEVVIPTYYYRQTTLLRHQMGDALCACRRTSDGECEPLNSPVYNNDFDTQQFIMSKKSEFTEIRSCATVGGQCRLTSKLCKGQYNTDEPCNGPINRQCCILNTEKQKLCDSNPTNAIRGGTDCGGGGWWNATRAEGKSHSNIDVLCTEGDAVYAPVSGILTVTARPQSCNNAAEITIGIKSDEAVTMKYLILDPHKINQLVQKDDRIGTQLSCDVKQPCSAAFLSVTRWRAGIKVDPSAEYGGPVVDSTKTTI